MLQKNYNRCNFTKKLVDQAIDRIKKLSFNNFIFNCINYLQIKDCAMDAICRKSYRNIFLWLKLKYKYIYK